MGINKLTFEDNSKLIDVESTLKMLLTTDSLKPYQKEWVVKSYKKKGAISNTLFPNKTTRL